MKLFVKALLFLFMAFPALAEDVTIQASTVLSVHSGYQEDIYYRAVLAAGEEDADLYIFTREDQQMYLSVLARNIVFMGGMAGTEPSLTQSAKGALQVLSQNASIGRNRWEQTLTIVYRGGQFLVGGYTYSYYDTLELDANGDIKSGACDVNLLTGRGVKDGKPFRTSMKAIPVQKWAYDTRPSECAED